MNTKKAPVATGAQGEKSCSALKLTPSSAPVQSAFRPYKALRTLPSRPNPTDFGTWQLVGTHLILKRQDWHSFDLVCNSSAEILDQIFHYRSKRLTPQETADLLTAIELILNPRSNFCSFGQDLRPSGTAFINAYFAPFHGGLG